MNNTNQLLLTINNNIAELRINNNSLELPIDEMLLLLHSKTLNNFILNRKKTEIVITINNNIITFMDKKFILNENYINKNDKMKYRCIKIDNFTNTAILRPLVKGKRTKLISCNMHDINSWLLY